MRQCSAGSSKGEFKIGSATSNWPIFEAIPRFQIGGERVPVRFYTNFVENVA
jgi:hypothetical protein